MTRTMKQTMGGLVAVALALGLTTGVLITTPLRAQPASPPMPMNGQPLTHDDMRQMMDAMHGEGASERMHAAMGDDADALMDQCAAMMAMMGRQQNQSLSEMMQRMMGRSIQDR